MASARTTEDGARRCSLGTQSLLDPLRSPKRQRIIPTGTALPSDQLNIHAVRSEMTPSRSAGLISSPSAPLSPPTSQARTIATTHSLSSSSNSRLSSAPGAQTTPPLHKRRFTRSRSGCNTCRVRKIKCDEARPHCRRCVEDGRSCQGYGQDQQRGEPNPSQKSPTPSVPSSLQATTASAAARQGMRPSPSQQVLSANSHQAPPFRGLNSANSLEADTPYPATSPQHLEDWLELLRSSIGNEIPHSIANSTTFGIDQQQSDHGSDNKQASLQVMTRLQQTASSNTGKSILLSDAPSDVDQGLSTLANVAVGGADYIPSHLESPHWLNEDWLSIFTASPANSFDEGQANSGPECTVSPLSRSSSLPVLEKISETDLQRRIRALCVTKVQLESVSFFFNATARCFHLLPADTNVWRIFFAQLASESPVILDLVGCLGLTHLSLTHDHRRKALAHAHFSRCKTEWDSNVGVLDSPDALHRAASQITTAHRLLEILAGTILIAHVEQFSRGLATSSRAYTALAFIVIRRALNSAAAPWIAELDQGPGSAFRFFVRILLWWETMSRTMGPASEQGDVLDIFERVYQWEEPDDEGQDPIGCSMQCVVGWPLDLLEAVERTTRLSLDPEVLASQPSLATAVPLVTPSVSLSHALEGSISLQLQQQIETIETQIRLSRPASLMQDDSIAAELRYLIFECLQSASLVYFCKMFLKSTDAVWFEINKVTRFLERKQQSPEQPDTTRAPRSSCDHSGSITHADLQVAQAMEARGKWWIRAPDGALIWAYFQCASEIFGALDPANEVMSWGTNTISPKRQKIGSGDPVRLALGSQLTLGSDVYAAFAKSRAERRRRCRGSILLWEKYDEIQCVFLCRHLLKAIWDRRDLYEQRHLAAHAKDTGKTSPDLSQARYDQVAELKEIRRQRRWKQPLVF